MHLLERDIDGQLSLKTFPGPDKPPYAILSHTWGNMEDEVVFQDMKNGTAKGRLGYDKINFCAEQMVKDNLNYIWVDTCCIDKSSSAELSEAIISMFKWYKEAAKCYVYLSDVSSRDENGAQTRGWMTDFKGCRWFTRGWTLQELIAPTALSFFSKEGDFLGDRHALVREISDVTGIDVELLKGRKQLSLFTHEEKISWIKHRKTQKEEDLAYSLLGILGIHMSIHYGEGYSSAMHRLLNTCRSTWSPNIINKISHRKQRLASSATKYRKGPDRCKEMRPLCRFYEPLVLLYTLGTTEEDILPVSLPTQEEISYLPPNLTRRNFLQDLAFLCDYDIGDETVVVMALQSLQQQHVLWIASNTPPARRIIGFARSRLADIGRISTLSGSHKSGRARNFIEDCIRFAAPRIHETMSRLIESFRECKDYLEGNISEEVAGLVEWISSCADQNDVPEICSSAYRCQRSKYMHTLARLGSRFLDHTGMTGSQNPFVSIRSHMIHLGRRYQAAKALLTYEARMSELQGPIDVCPVPTPSGAKLPPADTLTNFDKIVGRMLPDKSHLDDYQNTLTAMTIDHDLFNQFLHNYDSGNIRPFVHAEVQLLDLFHTRQYSFTEDDRFIASSRLACLSCWTYFNSHPGRFVLPTTDRSICLNWRPPTAEARHEVEIEQDSRSTMDEFNKRLRREALHETLKKSSIPSGHSGFLNIAPDTRTFGREQGQKMSYQEIITQLRKLISPREQSVDYRKNTTPLIAAPNAASAAEVKGTISNGESHRTQLQFVLYLEEGIDDSDSEGGVELPLQDSR